jgi:hypothetical protein
MSPDRFSDEFAPLADWDFREQIVDQIGLPRWSVGMNDRRATVRALYELKIERLLSNSRELRRGA